jgi:hypothetical protein
MVRSGSGRRVLVAALLLLPLLVLAFAPGAHEGHGCRFDKTCLACRWAADSAAEAAAPTAVPQPADAVSFVAFSDPARPADRAPEAASSRGPPLA